MSSPRSGRLLPRHRALLAVTAIVLLVAGSLVALPRGNGARAAGGAGSPVRLGFFYIPPRDGTSVQQLASTADWITLTQGGESYRDQLRANGYSGLLLQYIVAGEVEGPGPYANSSAACNANYVPMRNNVSDTRGDFCTWVHPNESWFLHNGKGERLYSRVSSTGVHYHMNPASLGWRSFALKRMQADLAKYQYDGIFLDNVELSWTKDQKQLANSDGVIKEFTSPDVYRSAWVGYLQRLSGGIRPAAKLWANMVADPNAGNSWDSYLTYLDGGMFESWAVGYRGLTPERWNNNLRQAESALRSGKGVLAVSPGPKTDSVKQTFALASYLLIGDQANAFFRYASDTNAHEYTSFWQFPNYDAQLGSPLGARYQDGSVWRRDFECGYVTVDPAAKTGQLVETCSQPPATPTATATATPTNTPTSTPEPSPTSTPAPTNTPSPTATTPPIVEDGTLVIRMTGVTDGQVVSGSVAVKAEVVAPEAKRKVKFYLDGGWLWSEGLAPYWLGGDVDDVPNGFDTRGWSNGTHVLSASVTDIDGKVYTTRVTIEVRN